MTPPLTTTLDELTPQPSEQPDATIRYREHTENVPGHKSWWRCIPISEVDLYFRLYRSEAAAPDPVASPPEAVIARIRERYVKEVLNVATREQWFEKMRGFLAVLDDEARRYLAATEEGTP